MQAARKIQTLLPDLTDDDLLRIDAVIDRNRGKPGCLIPVLEECQEIFGYLPAELQEHIGKGLNIAGSTIYGVVTFYSFFTMVPKGRHIIKVCMGTACYVKGIGEVMSRIKAAYSLEEGETTPDRRFSLESVRCLGACGLAPVIVIGKDTHGFVTPDSILDILARYK
jgi:NADH:ubiquinone oxidoreductase subunit E